MKRLSPEQRLHQIRANAKRDVRRRKKARSHSRNRRAMRSDARHDAPRRHRDPAPPEAALRVYAPAVFALEFDTPRHELVEMLATVRRRVEGERKAILVDFTSTKRMFPSGTLLFMAEIDRMRRITGDPKLIRGTYPDDVVVEQVLQRLGLLSMLGLEARKEPEQFPDNVRHWCYATGELADGEAVEPIVKCYEGVIAASLKDDLYSGITEAMTNSAQHAYEHPRTDDPYGDGTAHCRSWWMFSQEKDGALTVALCDLGIGIPASLAETKTWPREVVEKALRAARILPHRHAHLIRSAVNLHKTRTREAHRGKGFSEILDVVRRCGTGYLQIMSDYGIYRVKGSGGHSLKDYGESIKGSLVQWTIPLLENHDGHEKH
jgi:hypothetical protein